MIKIRDIIYHILHKKQHDSGTIELNPTPLVSDSSHQTFLDALIEAYKGRASKGYGRFVDDDDEYSMPSMLDDFLNSKKFYPFSTKMMQSLQKHISGQMLATGGTVFIIHYSADDKDYMLIAILSQKIAFTTEHWQMAIKEMLDLQHLKYAGRINITDWRNKRDRYVSFLKGKDEIAKYFKYFLSCDDTIAAPSETVKLVKAIHRFLQHSNISYDEKEQYLTRGKYLLNDISEKGNYFDLNQFANSFWPQSPNQLIKEFGEVDGVTDGFIPDKSKIKSLGLYRGKTNNWSLSFTNQALVEHEIEIIDKKIVIKNPPKELLEEINPIQNKA